MVGPSLPQPPPLAGEGWGEGPGEEVDFGPDDSAEC